MAFHVYDMDYKANKKNTFDFIYRSPEIKTWSRVQCDPSMQVG